MTEPNLVTGSYVIKSEYALSHSPLEMAIAGMEGAAYRFSTDAVSDARTRNSYMTNIKRMSSQVQQDVATGKISAIEGVKFCHEMRNKIMFEHRKFTSVQGLAVVEKKKKLPPTLKEILNRYADTKFGTTYDRLDANQKKKVHYAILESSGRDNVAFTNGTKVLKIMGKVGIVITASLAVYEIAIADNKVKETTRQGVILGGGAAGGALAGLTVSMLCGPGAPICAAAVVLVGSIAGGVAGSVAADSLDQELEEFSHWDIF